jgi:hypothetical protein
MHDESVPDLPGQHFFRCLRRSRLEGIADAAKHRVEMNLAAGETSWVAVSFWFDLALWQGDETHLDWVLALAEAHGHQIHSMAMKALAGCPSPHVVKRVAGMIRAGTFDSFEEFGRNQPDLCFQLLHERLIAGELTGQEVFRAYGRCVPGERLAEARTVLLSLRDPAQRMAAVYAVNEIARRNLSAAGLEPILLAPVETLERGGAESYLLSTARYAVEYNPVTWSERAAAALERAGYPTEARKVRAGLQSPWKRG